jgi:hypothetical protein
MDCKTFYTKALQQVKCGNELKEITEPTLLFAEMQDIAERRLVYYFDGIARGDSVNMIYDIKDDAIYFYQQIETGQRGYDAPDSSDGMSLPYYGEAGPRLHKLYAVEGQAEVISAMQQFLDRHFIERHKSDDSINLDDTQADPYSRREVEDSDPEM